MIVGRMTEMMVIVLMAMTTEGVMAIPKKREKDLLEEVVKLEEEEVVVERGVAVKEWVEEGERREEGAKAEKQVGRKVMTQKVETDLLTLSETTPTMNAASTSPVNQAETTVPTLPGKGEIQRRAKDRKTHSKRRENVCRPELREPSHF